jgi:hypothetical protein
MRSSVLWTGSSDGVALPRGPAGAGANQPQSLSVTGTLAHWFPIADYFALSVPRFAARAWLHINLLCVLGEVISEREADLVHGV